MEDNNDFEKYEGYKDSVETLLGTNEKSSSMSSRERVDDAVEEAGAEFLSKYGVPKELGKKVIKSNGGKLSPTNYGVNKLAKNYTRNKAAKGLEKLDKIKKKNNSNNSNDQTSQRINQSKQRRSLFGRNKSSSNDEVDSEDANTTNEKSKLNNDKKSNVNKDSKNEPSLKSRLKNFISRDKAKSKFNSKLGTVKVKIAVVLSTILIFLVIVPLIFIQFILGPIIDAVDEAVTGVADFSESVFNFYSAFGFKDSKEAFYDEIDTWCDRYDCSTDGTGLDVILILSTIFYPESADYNTDFKNIENENLTDPSAVSSNNSILTMAKEFVKDKINESQNTVDENGITYNAGKVYRFRKLARNSFYTDAFGIKRPSGEPITTSIYAFLDKYKDRISGSMYDLCKSIWSSLSQVTSTIGREIWALISDNLLGTILSGTFIENYISNASDGVAASKDIIGSIFYGLASITDINFVTGEITYREFSFDEDNYKNYLMKYYFEYMPEYSKLLGALEGEEREEKKETIYRNIVQNKKLFEEIYLQNQNTNSENYTNNCVGAIDTTLVSKLNKPVDIVDSTQISFDGEYAFGVVNGKNHNGVDLNKTTVGVNLGSNVYSVASGKVESVEDSVCKDGNNKCGKSIKIKHSLVIDDSVYNFFTIYSNITLKSGIKQGTSITKGDTIGTIYNSNDNTEGLHFTFMDANSDDTGIAIDPTNIFIECTNTTTLNGADNEEKTWNYLLGKGFTKIAAAGIIGNLMAETGLKPDNVEDASRAESLYGDEKFTAMIDNGTVTRNEFIQSEKYGVPAGWHGYNYNGLTYGYGLAQWTDPTRKGNFYDSWIGPKKGASIGDLGVQLDFIMTELETDSYSYIKSSINNASSASAAADIFWNYEVGAAQELRRSYANEAYTKFTSK